MFDRIVRADNTKFVLFVRKNILVLAFDANFINITECDSHGEIVHYDGLAVQDNDFKNEIHVSEFIKGNVAIKFNSENAIETLKKLFDNGFHFYSTTDHEAIENMKSHIEYVADEDKACPMDVFFLPMAINVIENSCIVYDLHSKSLKYSLQKDILNKDKTLCKINVINFGGYHEFEPKFKIYEIVHVKDEVRSYTGLITNYDDINNEYEIAYSVGGKHVTHWVPERYIFKVSDKHCEEVHKND